MATQYTDQINEAIRSIRNAQSAVYNLPSWLTMTGKGDSGFVKAIDKLYEAIKLVEQGRDETDALHSKTPAQKKAEELRVKAAELLADARDLEGTL